MTPLLEQVTTGCRSSPTGVGGRRRGRRGGQDPLRRRARRNAGRRRADGRSRWHRRLPAPRRPPARPGRTPRTVSETERPDLAAVRTTSSTRGPARDAVLHGQRRTSCSGPSWPTCGTSSWLEVPDAERVHRMARRDGGVDDVADPSSSATSGRSGSIARPATRPAPPTSRSTTPTGRLPGSCAPDSAVGYECAYRGKATDASARVTFVTDISSRASGAPRGSWGAGRPAAAQGLRQAAQGDVGADEQRAVRLLYLAPLAVRVDDRQFAALHRSLAEVGAVLDAPSCPSCSCRRRRTPA